MERRDFITLLGGAAAWPLTAHAQQSERMRRIGVILGNIETDPEAQVRIAAFRQRLAESGWIEARSISFEYRFGATHPDRIRSVVRELVDLGPDAILGAGTPIAVALKGRTIPIVFALVGDPVASGLVTSLARPGENMTGLTNYEYTMGENGWRRSRKALPLLRAYWPSRIQPMLLRQDSCARSRRLRVRLACKSLRPPPWT